MASLAAPTVRHGPWPVTVTGCSVRAAHTWRISLFLLVVVIMPFLGTNAAASSATATVTGYTRITHLLYSSDVDGIIVAHSQGLDLLDPTSLSTRASYFAGDPAFCNVYHTGNYPGAAYDDNTSSCWGLSQTACNARDDCLYFGSTNGCRTTYFASNCNGNVFYQLQSHNASHLLACSALDQCRFYDKTTLSPSPSTSYDYPQGYFCDYPVGFPGIDSSPVQEATLQNCPTWRYGPSSSAPISDQLYSQVAFVTAPDLSDPNTPNVIFMASSAQQSRDSFLAGMYETRVEQLTKRRFPDFHIACAQAGATCANGVPSSDNYIPPTSAGENSQIVEGRSHHYLAGHYTDDFVYFLMLEAQATSPSQAIAMRFCRNPPNALGNQYNGFARLRFACGGDETITSAFAFELIGDLTSSRAEGGLGVAGPSFIATTTDGVCLFTLSGDDVATAAGEPSNYIDLNVDMEGAFSETQSQEGCTVEQGSLHDYTDAIYVGADARLVTAHELTAATIDQINGHFVVYTGHSNGTVLQHFITDIEVDQTTGSFTRVATSSVLTAASDVTAITVDALRDQLIVSSSSNVNVVDAANCANYDSCAACAAAANPSCGWCVLESRCSTKAACTATKEEPREAKYDGPHWLHLVDSVLASCPALVGVAPRAAPIGGSINVTITTSGVPDALAGGSFGCVLNETEQFFEATKIGDNFVCTVTPAEHNNAEEFEVLESVALTYNGTRVTLSNHAAVNASLHIYDCSVLEPQGCNGCREPCGWCSHDNTCTFADSQCRLPAHFITSASACPQASELTPTQVHSASSGETALLVLGASLPDPDTNEGDEYTCTVEPSTGLSDNVLTATFVNASVVQCDLPAIAASVLPDTGILARTVELRFNGRAVQAPNVKAPASFDLQSYDCPIMGGGSVAGECGRCLAASHIGFDCGWCMETQQACTRNSSCSSSVEWIPNADGAISACPQPEIISVEPIRVPNTGGSAITIRGTNLGRSQADIQSVTIGTTICAVDSFVVASGRLVCLLAATTEAGALTVAVTVDGGDVIQASQRVTVVIPTVARVTPQQFIAAGGAQASIAGTNLQTGSSLSVAIDGVPCVVNSHTDALIRCTMSERPDDDRRRRRDAQTPVCLVYDGATECAASQVPAGSVTVVDNPTIAGISPSVAPRSGGVVVDVLGERLAAVYAGVATVLSDAGVVIGRCSLAVNGSRLRCRGVPGLAEEPVATGVISHWMVTLDNLVLNTSGCRYFPDPVVTSISPGEAQPGDLVLLQGRFLTRAGNVTVLIGGVPSSIESASDDQLTVLVPDLAIDSQGFVDVEVRLGNASSVLSGETLAVRAASSAGSDAAMAIGLAVGLGVLVVLVVLGYFLTQRRRKAAERKLIREIEERESSVIEVAKKGFAELQAAGVLAVDSDNITPRRFDDFARRVFFTHPQTHPAPSQVLPGTSELSRQFKAMLLDESFVLEFIGGLEAQGRGFAIRDRCQVASLLTLALRDDPEYLFHILEMLLAQQVEQSVKRNHAKLLLRRTESVAEKLLTTCLSLGMYGHIRHHAAAELFNLYQALTMQTEKGPMDAVTGAAMYTLNADTLLRERVDYQTVEVTARLSDGTTISTTCLDCDTISQVTAKLRRHHESEVEKTVLSELIDGVLREDGSGRILQDVDETSLVTARSVQLNTLRHYGLVRAVSCTILSRQAFEADLAAQSGRRPNKRRFTRGSVSQTSDGAQATLAQWHLVKTETEAAANKMPSEVFLTYLMTVKMTVQPFVEKLLDAMFNAKAYPVVVKRVFDLLDRLAGEQGMTDPEVLHVWKNNAVTLRFWINLIKNPEFLFEVDKSLAVNSCLSTVAQVVMDASSTSEQQLGKHSPANKHLYRTEVAAYKNKIQEYYASVHDQEPVENEALRRAFEEATSDADLPSAAAALQALAEYGQRHQEGLQTHMRDHGHVDMAADLGQLLTFYKQAADQPFEEHHGSDSSLQTGTVSEAPTDYLTIRGSQIIDEDLFDLSRAQAEEEDEAQRSLALQMQRTTEL